jgi:hypothetical protein
MSFSLSKVLLAAFALLAMLAATGCIADSAEDKDLPWSSNQGWEGMVPLPAGALNQYD